MVAVGRLQNALKAMGTLFAQNAAASFMTKVKITGYNLGVSPRIGVCNTGSVR